MSRFKKTLGRYGMHSGSAKFRNLEVTDNMWVSGVPMYNVKGDIFYVDSNKTVGGDGSSWDTACTTITAALALVVNEDSVIFIREGTYAETGSLTLTTTHNGLKLIGTNNTQGFEPVYLTDSTSNAHIIVVNGAENVEIANLGFYSTVDTKYAIVGGVSGSATSAFGLYIHDCYCYCSNGEGFFSELVNPDCPDLVIERCKVQGAQTAAIKLFATRGEVRDCFIKPLAAKIGIDYKVRGAFERISGNHISGVNSTDTGIKLTTDTRGAVIVTNNSITNCGTAAITQDVGDENVCANNWTYGGAGTAAVVDPTS